MKSTLVLMMGILLGGTAVWLSPRQPAANGSVAAKTTGEATVDVRAAAQGRVQGKTENIEIGASADGLIGSLLVKEGQEVTRGQIIGRISCDNLDAEIRALQASLESTKHARARLLQGSREEERRMAGQEVAAAEATLEQARRQNQRMQFLASRDDVSQQTADTAKRDLATAEAALGSAVAKQQLVNAGPLPEEVLKADADVSAAEERVRATIAQREKCVIRAPISGAITRVNMHVGEAYSGLAPRPIVTMADLSERRIRAEVDERDIPKVQTGERVRASAEGFKEPFFGKVVRTSVVMGRKTARGTDPAEKADRDVLEVWIAPDPGAPRLPVGLRVVVEFLE